MVFSGKKNNIYQSMGDKQVVELIRNQNAFEQDTIIGLYVVLRIEKINAVVKELLLMRDMFLPEVYLQKMKKEYKSSRKQETLDTSIKTNYTRFPSDTIWLMVRARIHPEEQLPTYYYLI